MFKDRPFNIFLLISLSWHILWISAVAIITVPTGLPVADYTKVYFLGPILEETAFELMLEESGMRVETLYRKPLLPKYAFEIEVDTHKDEFAKPAFDFDRSLELRFSPKEVIREKKLITPYFFKEGLSSFRQVPAFESPIKRRPVIFRPDKIPAVPRRITADGESFRVQLEFTVTPEGGVGKVKPVISSGNPQIDMIGMEYLKRWRFAPLLPSQEQKDYVGTFEVELKPD